MKNIMLRPSVGLSVDLVNRYVKKILVGINLILGKSNPDSSHAINCLHSFTNEVGVSYLYDSNFLEWYYVLERLHANNIDDGAFVEHLALLEPTLQTVLFNKCGLASLYKHVKIWQGETISIFNLLDVMEAASRPFNSGKKSRIDVLTQICPSVIANLTAGLRIIDIIWPCIFQEIEVVASRINVYTGDNIIGASYKGFQGSVFLRPIYISTPVDAAEGIVHEASHNTLNLVMSLGKIYENSNDELFTTPLRKDPRPAFGLIHQYFVLIRLKEFFDNYSRAFGNTTTNSKKLIDINENIVAAKETIDKKIVLTSYGEEIINGKSCFSSRS